MTRAFLERYPEIVLAPEAPMLKAMEVMTKSQIGIALVADKRRRLLGVVTDIDIRKALLNHSSMDIPIGRMMTRTPITASEKATRDEIVDLFGKTSKAYIPVVARDGRLTGLAALAEFVTLPRHHPNWVVVMAGGMGTRLKPLTQNIPKPLVRVGDKPILELLLEQFLSAGFGRFILAVNHMADQIKDYCGDGGRWNAQIEYIQESEPLGTAGALSLIRRDLGGTFLVVNGDILTKVNFQALLRFHQTEKALATLCIKQHETQVPYGVIELADRKLKRIVEKPVHRVFVNAGIYALEPSTLRWLPKRRHCHMPDFLETIARKKRKSVACFPLQEYWLDVGRPQDHERAKKEYKHR